MKKLPLPALFMLLVATSLLSITDSYSQVSNSIADLIKAQDYVFVAQTASPTRGGLRQLDPGYDLVVKKDSVVAFLPYFGRSYNAPIGSTDGGIKFTSTAFEYNVKDRNKGGWDIQIKPTDNKDVRILQLSVFENGSASLIVTSNSRQNISFNGRIEEKRR